MSQKGLTSEQQEWLAECTKDYNIVFSSIHGSRLYGLDHEKSDTDVKAIYLPSKTDLILGNAVKTVAKKSKELDIELELKSLSSFLKSAASCDTNCIDLLHTPNNMILYKQALWDDIVKHKSNLYAKNMKGIIGYIKVHSKKYTNKIDRLNEMRTLLSLCESATYRNMKISDFVRTSSLETLGFKYIKPVIIVDDHEQQYLDVCGKKYIFTWDVRSLKDAMITEINRYGKRSNTGLEQGMDTKSLSHALRVLLQLKEIVLTRDLHFPLKEAGYVKAVKMGDVSDSQEVMSKIDSLYEECMDLIKDSNLPEDVDVSEMYRVVEDYYFN